MNELSVATEVRPAQPDPVRQLACALLLLALEDATRDNQDIGLEARRFLFGKGEEYRQDRERWLMLAGLPFDCLERFREHDAHTLKVCLRGLTAGERKGRRQAQ